MKKFLVLIVIIGLGFGGYYWYSNKNKNHEARCEDGFRFNPATQSCEPVQEDNKTGEVDFSKVKIKTEGNRELSLTKEGDTTKFSAKYQDPNSASNIEFVSLDAKEAIKYSDEYVLAPYLYTSGGTGQFVYIGLFDIKTNTQVDSLILGDRIAIDSISIVNEKAKINFKDRLLTESFAVEPTIPTQFVLEIKNQRIIPIIQVQNADYSEIEIKTPAPNSEVTNELDVKGAIPGSWYFEAVAHYRILNSSYQEIAIGSIQALSDWMTTQRVPFELKVSTENLNYKGSATVIIESENVRGDEEGEKLVKRIYLPIVLK